MKSGDWMVLSILMALGLILLMLGRTIALGEANLEDLPSAETPGTYELYALPPIRESECPSDLFVAQVMRVEVDEADLRENERLRVMLALPYSASQVFAVYLTDWEHWVPPDMEENGDNALRLTFESAAVRVISDGAWVYLLVIAIL